MSDLKQSASIPGERECSRNTPRIAQLEPSLDALRQRSARASLAVDSESRMGRLESCPRALARRSSRGSTRSLAVTEPESAALTAHINRRRVLRVGSQRVAQPINSSVGLKGPSCQQW